MGFNLSSDLQPLTFSAVESIIDVDYDFELVDDDIFDSIRRATNQSQAKDIVAVDSGG